MHKSKTKNLEKLVNESLESYYWLGFLMADGCITNTHKIQLLISIKDIEHLKRFGNFIGNNNIKERIRKSGQKSCSIVIGCSSIYNTLINKYKLVQRKTYNPPDLSYLEGDKFIAFLIGYIDGDGCITNQNKTCAIRIKLHKSWLNNLQIFSNKLSEILRIKPKKAILIKEKDKRNNFPNETEFSRLIFTGYKYCYFLKKKALELNLPILTRKWDRINENQPNKFEIYNKNIKQISNYQKDGLNKLDIMKNMNISIGQYYRAINKIKNNGVI